MKNLKNFLPFGRDTLFYHLLMLTPVILHAQTSSQPVKKEVQYFEIRKTVYAIPDHLNPEELSTFDLVEAVPYTESNRVKITFNNLNEMQYEKTFEASPSGISLNDGMDRFVSNAQEQIMYTVDGKAVTPDLNEDDDYLNLVFSSEQVTKFPYVEKIHALTASDLALIQDNGYATFTDEDGNYIVQNADMDIIINHHAQTLEYRRFENDYLKMVQITSLRLLENGKALKKSEITKSYRILSSGIVMEIQDIIEYDNYYIVEDNEIVLDERVSQDLHAKTEKNSSLNPTESHVISNYKSLEKLHRNLLIRSDWNSNLIDVQLPTLRGAHSKIDVFNAAGQLIISQKLHKDQVQIALSLHEYPGGYYIIKYEDESGIVHQSIIKP
ncbi:MAG: T9SS type A sorting domain-containing protein [Bacteroidota bacterium]|nr:T9SS type A sorting domain-containing protein [Bacteroidota bacterium]